jgi:hypothetical protein
MELRRQGLSLILWNEAEFLVLDKLFQVGPIIVSKDKAYVSGWQIVTLLYS